MTLLHITDTEYRALDAISNSELTLSKKSPWHARNLHIQETDPMRWGTAVHMALHEPERFRELYVVEPIFIGKTKDGRDSTQSAEAKAKKAEWYESLPEGALVLAEDDMALLTATLEAIRDDVFLMGLLEGSYTEVSTQWEMDGLPCKARADILNVNAPFILDMKTCADASLHEFAYQSLKRGYHRQLAWYAEGFGRAIGSPIDKVYLLAVESKLLESRRGDPPRVGIALYELDGDDLIAGHQEVMNLFSKYRENVKANNFPLYGANTLKLPRKKENE